ncbi:hypothetical protein M405DRAFT_935021 [Rhizopogon salebrosus TDB-379]|nr:hypothetical protein M405DRAFT_935021 [Rhizopogon salebrosus TDB-379]
MSGNSCSEFGQICMRTLATFISNELVMASFTLVVYDHAITFSQEVKFFWSGSWSASRVLYLSIRYSALTQMLIIFYARVTTLSLLA